MTAGRYQDRPVALATRHGKERAVGPPLRRHLNASLKVAEDVDTDALGTFSGEVRRIGTAKETAFAKARLGMAATGLPLGLASEGSFAPHPTLGFVPADHEIVAFVDSDLGLEIAEGVLSLRTNFAHLNARPGDDIGPFLKRIGFPSHAVIVRPLDGDTGGMPVAKGIIEADDLARATQQAAALSSDGRVRIETDMRAHLNPTRMAVIRATATRLALRLASTCPACEAPGWGRVGVERGLPCRACGEPTELVAAIVEGCAVCTERRRQPRPDGRAGADPGECPACNP